MKKWCILILLIIVAAPFIIAQVDYEMAVTSNGLYGNGAYKSSTVTYIQGDARRTETKMQFTGSLMKHLSPKGTEIEITRLDKKLFWKFNDKDKKYTELTFAEYKEMVEKGQADLAAMTASPTDNAEQEKTETDYEWQEPKVEVKKTGEKQNLNGFNCDNYLLTVTTIGKHKQTGIQDTMLYKTDLWNIPAMPNAIKIATEFDQKLMTELGINPSDIPGFSQMVAQFKEQAEPMMQELKKIEGYAIKTDMRFIMTTHAMQAQQAESGEAQKEENQVALDDLKGSLGGMLGKKLAKKATEKAEKQKSSAKEIYQATSEVKAIHAKAVDAALFEVPANYKLKK